MVTAEKIRERREKRAWEIRERHWSRGCFPTFNQPRSNECPFEIARTFMHTPEGITVRKAYWDNLQIEDGILIRDELLRDAR